MTCIGAILDLLFSVSGVTIPGVFEYYHSPNYCVIISLTSQRTSPSSILIVRDFQFNPSLKPTAVPSPKRHEVREKWSVLAETCWRDYPLTSRNTPDEWRKETVCSSNDCSKKLGFSIDAVRAEEWSGAKLKRLHFAHVRCRKSPFCRAVHHGNHAIVTGKDCKTSYQAVSIDYCLYRTI